MLPRPPYTHGRYAVPSSGGFVIPQWWPSSEMLATCSLKRDGAFFVRFAMMLWQSLICIMTGSSLKIYHADDALPG